MTAARLLPRWLAGDRDGVAGALVGKPALALDLAILLVARSGDPQGLREDLFELARTIERAETGPRRGRGVSPRGPAKELAELREALVRPGDPIDGPAAPGPYRSVWSAIRRLIELERLDALADAAGGRR